MFSKKHILILFLFLIVLLSAVSYVSAEDLNATDEMAAENDEIVIGTDEIESDELQASPKTFTDLNNAINSNKKSKIYLDSDYLFDSKKDSKYKYGIKVTRAVTIYGNGHTIDANEGARIFMASNKNIVFRDIIFANGYVRYNDGQINGGAIFGDFKCINCTFVNNSAVNAGAVHGGTVINCRFIDNYAYYWGGAMYYGSVYNCTFIGNRADYGGALWYCFACENSLFIDNFASLTGGAVNTAPVVNCTFIDNYAKYGGGLYIDDVYDIYRCTNSKFINNSAEYGGAIYYSDDIAKNHASRFSAVNCVLENNEASKHGGALYNVNAVNCRLTDNSAKKNGGAMYSGIARTSTFINNSADYGGALYKATSVDGTFKSNTAKTKGSKAYSSSFKLNTKIIASGVNAAYNTDKYLVVTLKDALISFAVANRKVSITLNGKTSKIKTDKSGKVKLSINGLAPGTYKAKITFSGDSQFGKSSKTVNVVVKKATPKISLAKMTYKAKEKVKKYKVTLKNGNNVVKNAKVKLKVNGRTYTAKTNAKGQATFKITKLTQKGTFKAEVKYDGNRYYNAKNRNSKITIE